jgi:hypothetical protein
MTDDPAHSTPRWVKLFGIIALVLILLVVVSMFIVGGNHGPRSHAPGMLTGFVLLVFRHGPKHPAPQGDTVAGVAVPSEGDHW